MIEIILIQLATAVACYFIGVFTGRQSAKQVIREWQAEHDSAAQEGYDEAVRHILEHGIFFDRKASEYKTVSICAIDGEITEEWNKRYNEYLISGHHMAIDVMVRRGVMNKRTGEKFKWRFEKIVKEIGEKHD